MLVEVSIVVCQQLVVLVLGSAQPAKPFMSHTMRRRWIDSMTKKDEDAILNLAKIGERLCDPDNWVLYQWKDGWIIAGSRQEEEKNGR